jgi:hypothetical protein
VIANTRRTAVAETASSISPPSAWDRLCGRTRAWIPAESQNRVLDMSTTNVPCPCTDASISAVRSPAAFVRSIPSGRSHHGHTADHHNREPVLRRTLLTGHGHVLVEIARDPTARMRDMAAAAGITERTAQVIVADLEAAGYVTRTRTGRRTRYTVNRDACSRIPHRKDTRSAGSWPCWPLRKTPPRRAPGRTTRRPGCRGRRERQPQQQAGPSASG